MSSMLITAHLDSPLAGDAPQLDALLESALSLHHPKGLPGHKVDRNYPAPLQGEIPIPIVRRRLGGWHVAACSNPILASPSMEMVEHINKRIGVEHAAMLDEGERRVIATGNSWTKSYRLPLRVRSVSCVRWFAVGNRHDTLFTLRRHVRAVGKKIADGYGRVERWEAEDVGEDLSWFAETEWGALLMRPLPVGPWLPDRMIGARKDFGACCPPMWHPDRYTEIVVPC